MTNKYRLKVTVASDVDYDELIAEVYCNGDFASLLQQEDGKENLKIEFSPNLKSVDLEWFQDALREARSALLGEN